MHIMYSSVYMMVAIIPKLLVQQQPFLITVKEADEDDWSEHSEVLIADLSLHRLRQRSSHANSESSGSISNWKKHLLFYPVSLWKTRARKYPLTSCLDEGTSHLFFLHAKRWKCCSVGVLNGCQHCIAQGPSDGFILLDIYCCQLPLVCNLNITLAPVHPD